MYKLLPILLISSVISANSLNNDLFDNGFKHNVWRDFEQLFQQFNYKMSQIQSSSNFGTKGRRYFDNQTNNYIIQLKVNGLNKENLDISTNNGRIFIKGRVKKIQNTAHSSSTSSGSFSQSFTLPYDVDTDNINASFNNNILTVSIPKLKQPKLQIRKITIQ
ncbi:heat shock protein Hsp20 [Isorropodon fossajaponicum endosymbiont JTNG4]|nr:heat shock protein Hsp20 [Isorropodon fossajaponicum endosymbiont JTNG4]